MAHDDEHDDGDGSVDEDGDKVTKRPAGKKKASGCLVGTFLAGAAMIAGGAYLMGRWAELHPMARAGSVVLVVLGTLLTLPAILLIGLKIAIKVFVGRALKDLGDAAKELAEAGKDIVGQNKALYGQIHEFREADDDDFDDLDRDYYDEVRRAHLASGYRHLGDLVDETVEDTSGIVVPIRVLASHDGAHTVAVYHMPMGGDDGEGMKVCDVTTEFSDGSFLMTSNTKGSNLMTPPPKLEQRLYPAETTVAALVAAHVAEVGRLLAAKGAGVTPVRIETLDDAIASERRQQEIKNAFRKGIGYVDPEEVRRITSTVTDEPLAGDIAAHAADKARRAERGEE